MAEKTHIEWCDSTLNLEMGCDGCELWSSKVRTCYAGVLTRKYEGKPGWPRLFEQATIFPERLPKALRWKDLRGLARPSKPWLDGLPRLIFLNDMGDTFAESLSIDWLLPFVKCMEASPHVWMILTKRPHRMARFFTESMGGRVPRNFWPGCSVTSRSTMRRMETLKAIGDERTVRWMSVEPILDDLASGADFRGIAALLAGGESGNDARPMQAQWADNLFAAARRDGCRWFWKQWGIDKNNPDQADPTRQSAGGYSKGGARLHGREWRELPAIERSGELVLP